MNVKDSQTDQFWSRTDGEKKVALRRARNSVSFRQACMVWHSVSCSFGHGARRPVSWRRNQYRGKPIWSNCVRQPLPEFGHRQPLRSRLPEPWWAAETEWATCYGVHRIARELHLDYTGRKKRVQQRERPKQKRAVSATPTLVELVGPTTAVTGCRVEVQSAPGQRRLDLPAGAASELAHLLRAFLGQ